jgi:hypothetical protein
VKLGRELLPAPVGTSGDKLSLSLKLGRELLNAYISVADGEVTSADGESAPFRPYLGPMLLLINWVANY